MDKDFGGFLASEEWSRLKRCRILFTTTPETESGSRRRWELRCFSEAWIKAEAVRNSQDLGTTFPSLLCFAWLLGTLRTTQPLSLGVGDLGLEVNKSQEPGDY